MQLRRLSLHEVRSWPSLDIAFDGSTALVGGNATGKTTIIEAAFYSASLRSFRTSTDAGLIRVGADRAVIRAEVAHTRVETIELELVTKGRSRAQLGGAPVASRREILGVLRASVFGPERQAIIRGDPSERRGFADELLVMLRPRYHQTIREYERVVRQRNALLRAAAEDGVSPVGIEAWDESLIRLGVDLCAGRARALEALAPHAAAAYDAVAGDARDGDAGHGGGAFAIAYEPRCEHPGPGADEEAWAAVLTRKLEERRELERIRGTTLAGPHRDDLQIMIGAMPARTHASHGEAWLAALALTLGAHACIAETVHEAPVLLLDDPFTLLDPRRRERLAKALPEGQAIITAADPDEIPALLDIARIDVEPLR